LQYFLPSIQKKLLIFIAKKNEKHMAPFVAMLFWMGNKKQLIALISIFLGYGRTF